MTAITKLVQVTTSPTTLTDAVTAGTRAIVNLIGYTASGGILTIQLSLSGGATETIYTVPTATSFTLKNIVLKEKYSLVASGASGNSHICVTGFTEVDE